MSSSEGGPGSARWRHDRRQQLFEVASRSRREVGFGWLDDAGHDDISHDRELWINARMTYVFSLAAALGHPGATELAAHGVRALSTVFHDDEHGGWYDQVDHDGQALDTTKRCYGHAFVLLAGASASAAGIEGADALFAEARAVHARHFWDARAGRCVEELSRDWTEVDSYRGANSNMHTVESYLITADVTGDPEWRERADAICERIIGVSAQAHGWRIPEHYDAQWNPDLELNRDRPDDAFRPYGVTPGHAFEWARLLVQLDAAADDDRTYRLRAANALFSQAVEDALDNDTPLLPYTTDWEGEPVVTERFHWVVAEAVQAAEILDLISRSAVHRGLADRWWSEIDDHLVDDDGSWRHELTVDLQPSARTWAGRPDAYHAVNALTAPDLGLASLVELLAGKDRP